TVPSCAEHNSDKSGADADVKTGLIRGVDQVVLQGIREEIPEELRRSIQTMQRKYRQAGGRVSMQPLIANAPEDLDVEFPFVHQSVGIENWVRMLTAA